MGTHLVDDRVQDALSRAILTFYGTDQQLSLDERYFGDIDDTGVEDDATDVSAL